MKILHVIHSYLPESKSGAEVYVHQLVTEQRAQGLEVALLTGSMQVWDHCGTEQVTVEGVPVTRLHRDDWYFDIHAKAYHPGVERLVREVFAREQPDLIHVHQWIRLTSNLLEIADDLGIPVVVTLHDLYTSCPRAFRVHRDGEPCRRPLSVASCLDCVPRYGHEGEAELAEGIALHHEQYASELARARAVIVASQRTADLICASTGFPAGLFEVTPWAYTPRFPGGAPPAAPLPANDEPFRFGYWGNVTIRKGVQVLLEAVRQVTARGAARPFELHVFGAIDTDALRDQLHALAEGQPVVFHGRYSYQELAAARLHLAVFPIVCFETFGFVLDEAVELGLPSIVTDIGALPERAGRAALAVPPGDEAALAAALEQVLSQPTLRDDLARHLPALPPATTEHATTIRRIYDAALTRPTGLAEVRPVDPLRRSAFLVQQRESALRHAHPGNEPR